MEFLANDTADLRCGFAYYAWPYISVYIATTNLLALDALLRAKPLKKFG